MGELAEDWREYKEFKKAKRKPIERDRIAGTSDELLSLGFSITEEDKELIVTGRKVKFSFWPYTGWWSGKGLGSGRGFRKLIKRLKEIGEIKDDK